MDGYRREVADAKDYLKKEGRLGYFFLDENGAVKKEEWTEFPAKKKREPQANSVAGKAKNTENDGGTP